MSYQQTMLQYLADIRKDCATLLGSANIYVFGTGAVAALCQSALRHEKITPVAYVDNDVNKQGRVYEGRPVIALKDVPADATVLIAVQNPERRNQIERQMSTRGGICTSTRISGRGIWRTSNRRCRCLRTMNR